MLDELKLPASILLNSTVCTEYPEIVEKIRQRGDDVLGHGRTNAETAHSFPWEEDERRAIQECTEVIAKHVGVRPTGWMGPGAIESKVTADLLKEAGYTHLLDWPVDDQPLWMRTRSGPILSVPYPMELNDAGTLVLRDHTGRDFADMVVDQFEELLEQSEKQPLVFALSLHGFIVGQPFRLRPLRQAIKHCVEHKHAKDIWFTRAGEIYDYCAKMKSGTIPGSVKAAKKTPKTARKSKGKK
jgi:peptidoglycan/xylan/chitin deacetylase (PgdA/CDA1 family)